MPFLKLLIGIVVHVAILHLCVPILASFYEKNLYLKSVAGITIRKMKEKIYTRQGGTMQSPALYLMHFVSVKEQLMWTLKNQVEPPLNHPIP